VTRATLDSNVLVGAMPSRHGPLADLRRAWGDQRYDLIISEHVLEEVARAWQSQYWRQRIPPQIIRYYLDTLRTFAEVVPITARISGVASHPEDDLVLATAVSGDAEYLVTGDKQFLALDAYQSVRIVSPRESLDVLDRQKLGG